MGIFQSTECCEYSDKDQTLYLSGKYKIISDTYILYHLNKKQKKELAEFLRNKFGCIVDLRSGLLVNVPDKLPEQNHYVAINVKCIHNIIYFFYNSENNLLS